MFALPFCKLSARGEEADTTRRWAISTNICDWAMLGTMNLSASLAPGRRATVTAGIKYNPFTYYNRVGRAICFRQFTPYISGRYWFCEAYDGWFAGCRLIAGEFNMSNVFKNGYCDGDFVAAGIDGGYSRRISQRWNLTVAASLTTAAHKTTFYAGPVCGRILSRKKGLAVVPGFELTFDFLL